MSMSCFVANIANRCKVPFPSQHFLGCCMNSQDRIKSPKEAESLSASQNTGRLDLSRQQEACPSQPDADQPMQALPVQIPPPTSSANRSTAVATSGMSSVDLLNRRWFVLLAIFFAMMFLGLPLLWRCPAFSLLEKLFWTVATLVHSAVILWGFWWVMTWSWQRIEGAL